MTQTSSEIHHARPTHKIERFSRMKTFTLCFAMVGVVSVCQAANHPNPKAGIDWDSFGFGLNGVNTDRMWVNSIDTHVANPQYSSDCDECLVPLGSLAISPMSTVFNYGQTLFEGLKAFRREDGKIVVFRPDRNAARMQKGAGRFLLPPVPTEVFLKATDEVIRANAHWVPPNGKGALYLRPLLMGTGADLGVKPSGESTFCVFCSPVGNYFKGGMKAINLQAVRGFSRAAPGGCGAVKAGGNYAPVFKVQKEVKARGYDETLCLDAVTGEAIEEAGASNFFAVFPNKTIVTPSLDSETILAGVTRASILELVEKECGYTVREGRLTLSDLKGASEAFCCGTGASVTPVGSVSVLNKDGSDDTEAGVVFRDGQTPGPLTQKVFQLLLGIQTGSDKKLLQKYSDWIHIVEP
eukprot:Nitzschia sp. Nitz4//scaffold232_size35869//3897//5207//NITZ4_007801-RA/size35869-snap-gene-0.50-mRNA-1//-1//CDS//3329543312//3514//frame0